MTSRRLLILGGTGFIGRHLAAEAVRRGWHVTVPTRHRESARALTVLPTLDLIEADVHADGALQALIARCDAVVNLVGVLHSRPAAPGEGWGPAYARAHVALPARVAAACRAAGVRRLVQMSALGAARDAPSEYLRSRAAGEAAVHAVPGLDVTVFRPSVVFGPEDRFLNLFAQLARVLPVLMVVCPGARLQPVYVGDVVEALLESLARPAGAAPVDLCGPEVWRLDALVRRVCRMQGRWRLVIGLPDALSRLMAFLLEFTPGPVMTRDNYRSLQADGTSAAAFPYGIRPRRIEDMAPAWLGRR
jgi:uncharacterized protein YbjT (DUF2867 family)